MCRIKFPTCDSCGFPIVDEPRGHSGDYDGSFHADGCPASLEDALRALECPEGRRIDEEHILYAIDEGWGQCEAGCGLWYPDAEETVPYRDAVEVEADGTTRGVSFRICRECQCRIEHGVLELR